MSEETRQTLLKANPAISDTKESEEDVVLNISLRPKKFADFVGHRDVVDNLKIAIQATKQRKEPL
ncbi:MAG: Holliday junction branch migration DNA helicase RuvB, partial [Candidatus Omnitrophota bacterium]